MTGAPNEGLADVIANAREYGEKNGWWRGSLRGPNGRQACARGWLVFGNGFEEDEWATVNSDILEAERFIMTNVVAPEYGKQFGKSCVITWNDDKWFGPPNRQAVLDVFAKAEKIARAGYDPDA